MSNVFYTWRELHFESIHSYHHTKSLILNFFFTCNDMNSVLKGAPWRRKGLAKARGVTSTPHNRPRRRLKAWDEMRCDKVYWYLRRLGDLLVIGIWASYLRFTGIWRLGVYKYLKKITNVKRVS